MAKTVIVIDDDQDDLDLIKETIEVIDSSIQCICFSSADKAFDFLSSKLTTIPDFIFTDINMPQMTGNILVQKLRKIPILVDAVIIVFSTSIPLSVSKHLKEAGADFTFEKPGSITQFRSLFRQIFKSKDNGNLRI